MVTVVFFFKTNTLCLSVFKRRRELVTERQRKRERKAKK